MGAPCRPLLAELKRLNAITNFLKRLRLNAFKRLNVGGILTEPYLSISGVPHSCLMIFELPQENAVAVFRAKVRGVPESTRFQLSHTDSGVVVHIEERRLLSLLQPAILCIRG